MILQPQTETNPIEVIVVPWLRISVISMDAATAKIGHKFNHTQRSEIIMETHMVLSIHYSVYKARKERTYSGLTGLMIKCRLDKRQMTDLTIICMVHIVRSPLVLILIFTVIFNRFIRIDIWIHTCISTITMCVRRRTKCNNRSDLLKYVLRLSKEQLNFKKCQICSIQMYYSYVHKNRDTKVSTIECIYYTLCKDIDQ